MSQSRGSQEAPREEDDTPVQPMQGVEVPPGLGKRKDRDSGEFEDIDDEEEQIPTEMAGPPRLKQPWLKLLGVSSRFRTSLTQ